MNNLKKELEFCYDEKVLRSLIYNKIDDYVIGRRWNDNECWIESKRIDVKELRDLFERMY